MAKDFNLGMKKLTALLLLINALTVAHSQNIVLTKQQLQDKIKGGWAGQVLHPITQTNWIFRAGKKRTLTISRT